MPEWEAERIILRGRERHACARHKVSLSLTLPLCVLDTCHDVPLVELLLPLLEIAVVDLSRYLGRGSSLEVPTARVIEWQYGAKLAVRRPHHPIVCF